MLTELHIENIAVIEKADIEFGPGLNILTGETGAGKSIVIDSLGAAIGGRVSRDLLRSGAQRGGVTAVFEADKYASDWLSGNDIDCDDGELILQRKLTDDGKSSCRVCGVPVTAAQMKELGALLLDIHGQNDGRQLMDESRHRDYLDRFAGLDGVLSGYGAEYAKYRGIEKELSQLNMDETEKQRLTELLKYEIDELEKADISPGEQDEKTARRDLLHNAEKITEAVDAALDELYSGDVNAVSLIGDSGVLLSRAMTMSDELRIPCDTLNNVSKELDDAVERLRDFRESLDFSPQEYDELEERLVQLKRLSRKYSADEAGMLERLEADRRKLKNIEFSGDRESLLKKDLAAQAQVCRREAEKLSSLRKAAAKELEGRIVRELSLLSMPSVKFEVEFVPLSDELGFDRYGCDEIRFLISANAGEAPGRISRIASGGELSRIMLAMKNVFAEKDAVSSMVFDEIDSGVSGIAAQRVGEKLSDLSASKQVICVTHLPQIAAMADSHFVISKTERGGRTYTSVTPLDEEGRRMELARLHGGENITTTTLASAGEQLDAARAYKRSKNENGR
jgi:DNA repair protein RecN (Recombination protein N)